MDFSIKTAKGRNIQIMVKKGYFLKTIFASRKATKGYLATKEIKNETQ